MLDKQSVSAAFDRYVSQFNPDTPGILSKQRHSRTVSVLCETLARQLGWLRKDQDLAWVLGLLHDIGRFEQARRFHTFIDYKSMDHARYGVWYLFEKGHIRDSCRIRSQNGTGSWNWLSCGTMAMQSLPVSPAEPGISPC